MALPPQIQTVTVSFGPFIDFQGNPLAGSTRFSPSTPVNHAATGTPILNRPITVQWDEDGRGVLVLPATDSVGLDVTGFTYRVQHTFADGSVPAPPSSSIQLPAGVPSVDLDLLIPVPAQNGVVVSVPGVVSVAGRAGVVTAATLADELGAELGADLKNPATPLGAAGRAAFVPRDEYEAGGGGDGPGGYVHTQSSPSASWSINNPLGRIPGVDLYVGGVQVDADITASATTVAVSFPAPTAGIAVLV